MGKIDAKETFFLKKKSEKKYFLQGYNTFSLTRNGLLQRNFQGTKSCNDPLEASSILSQEYFSVSIFRWILQEKDIKYQENKWNCFFGPVIRSYSNDRDEFM